MAAPAQADRAFAAASASDARQRCMISAAPATSSTGSAVLAPFYVARDRRGPLYRMHDYRDHTSMDGVSEMVVSCQ